MRKLILISAAAAAMTLAGGLAHAQAPAPGDIIKAWDKDGDGTVSKDEWVAAGRPAERFELVDANHDGKISVEELTAAMARMRPGGGASPNAAPGQPAAPAATVPAPPPAGKAPH